MPKFMLQNHAATTKHQDLRLQVGEVYRSWAIPKSMPIKPGETRLAVPTPDHPSDFLLEGRIVEGYGAGIVSMHDVGEYTLKDPPTENKINFIVDSERMTGSFSLIKTGKDWLLLSHSVGMKYPDDDLSILTGRTMEEIAMGLPIKPQLAKLVDELPTDKGFVFEPKLDGYRVIASNDLCQDWSTTTYPEITQSCASLGPHLYTRSGTDITKKYPHIAAAVAKLPPGTIIDAELVVYDENGISSFQALQNANGTDKAVLSVFDLPSAQGTLLERKAQLKILLSNNKVLQYVEHYDKPFDACSMGLEGIIGKRADSLYQPNGRDNAVKMKCKNTQEFVILGYTEGKGKRNNTIGALLLGYYDDNKIRYAGRVGTGFDTAGGLDLFTKLQAAKPLVSEELSSTKGIPKNAHLVEPQVVAQAEFLGWTNDGRIRQGVFLGLREDKSPIDVRREVPDITHPTKLLFPEGGITKQGLADYFKSVEDRLVAEIKDRPLTLLRCPDGVDQPCFWQRNASEENVPRGLRVVCDDRTCRYVLASASGLQSLANLNVVEIHPWNNKVGENPDRMIFDLDPSEGLPWERTVKAATDLRAVLQGMGLEPYVRTTGQKGLHVVVPIKPDHEPGVIRELARDIAERMAEEAPDLYTASPNMRSRTGRVYIDWLRNDQGSTSIASWSPRSNSKGTVATPVSWEELPNIKPDMFSMALASMQNNPWADLIESVLNPLMFTR